MDARRGILEGLPEALYAGTGLAVCEYGRDAFREQRRRGLLPQGGEPVREDRCTSKRRPGGRRMECQTGTAMRKTDGTFRNDLSRMRGCLKLLRAPRSPLRAVVRSPS